MTKKKTKKATTKKPSAKVKTKTIETENFGELILQNDYDLNIITKTDQLMKSRKGMENIIIELALALEPFLKAKRRVTIDMKTVKQYVFDLVGYKKENIKKDAFAKTNEGFEADSNDYYEELNKRVYKVYPDLDNDSNAEERDDRPTVQRVTSASVGSRKKTQGNRNGVEFTPSEIKRLRGLKPYNMSEEDWLKRVAKEKVKATTRRETI